VGRGRIELWHPTPHGFSLREQQALEGMHSPDPTVLEAALRQVFHQGAETGAARASGQVDVVLESAWLPVMHFDLGDVLWSGDRIEALLRHRFGQLYGEHDVQTWELRLNHRAGDASGTAYGLAPAVKKVIESAAKAEGARLASLQPALAWGWDHLRRRRKALRSGWWIWLEEDRSLIGRFEWGLLRCLNAGAPLPTDQTDALRLVQIETVREGASELPVRGLVAGWPHALAHGASAGDHALTCVELGWSSPSMAGSLDLSRSAG
jgi:hypothetical protein